MFFLLFSLFSLLSLLTLCAAQQQEQQEQQEQQQVPADLPRVVLNCSGASFPQVLIREWAAFINRSTAGRISYTYPAGGSGRGVSDFLSGVNDFSCSDAPLTTAQFAQATKNNTVAVLHLPETLGAVVVAAKLPQSASNRKLWLTTELVALIFSGQIRRWNDPRLLAVNGGDAAPFANDQDNEIVVIRRNDSSGTTFAFTDMLRRAAPHAWATPAANAPAFPFWLNGTRACQGTAGVSACLNATQFGIAYLELGQAIELGEQVSVATLRDANCVFTEPAASSVSAALASAFFVPPNRDASWNAISIANTKGENVWPATTFSYTFVQQSQVGRGARGAALKAVLDWMMTREAQLLALHHGLVPLETKFAEDNQRAIRNMAVDNETLYQEYLKLLLPRPRSTVTLTLAPAYEAGDASPAAARRGGAVPRVVSLVALALQFAHAAWAQSSGAASRCLASLASLACPIERARDNVRIATYGPTDQPQFAPLFAAMRNGALDQQCVSADLVATTGNYAGSLAAVAADDTATPVGVTSLAALLAHHADAADAAAGAAVFGLAQLAKRSAWWLVAHKAPHPRGIASADLKLLAGKVIWRSVEQTSRAMLRAAGIATPIYESNGIGAQLAAEFVAPNGQASAFEARPHVELAALLTTPKEAGNASSPLYTLDDFWIFKPAAADAWPDDVLVVNGAWYARDNNSDVALRLLAGLTTGYVFCRDSSTACASASPTDALTRWPRVLAVHAYMDVVFDGSTPFGEPPAELLAAYRQNLPLQGVDVPRDVYATFVNGSDTGAPTDAALALTGLKAVDAQASHVAYTAAFCYFRLNRGATAAPCGTQFDDIDFVIPPPTLAFTRYVPGPALTRAPVDRSLSAGAIAGIVVGVVAAVLLIGALLLLMYLRTQRALDRERRQHKEAEAELEARLRESSNASGDALKIAVTAFKDAAPAERDAIVAFKEQRAYRLPTAAATGDEPVDAEQFALRLSTTQLTFGIGKDKDGAGGRLVQATAGQTLEQQFRIAHAGRAAAGDVTWQIAPVPLNFLYAMTFAPSEGTLRPGAEATVTAKLIPYATKKIRFAVAVAAPALAQFVELKVVCDVGVGLLLDPAELQFADEPLSHGAAGAIYEGLWRGQHVAIKQFKEQQKLLDDMLDDGTLWTEFMLEVQMLARLRHKKVVGFVGSVVVPKHMCIVTEWIGNGSLQTAVHTYSLNAGLKAKLVQDVADALRYCHNNQILHRDIKPSNVLIESFAANAAVNAKLGDFGSSREDTAIAAADRVAAAAAGGAATGAEDKEAPVDDFTKGVGTPVFMAPEIFRYEPHTTKSDVYSYGLLVYATFLETSPWNKETKAYNVASKVKKGKRPPLPAADETQLEASEDESREESAALPHCARELVVRCWAHEQPARPSADECFSTIQAWFEHGQIAPVMPAVLREGARVPTSMFVLTGGAAAAKRNALTLTGGSSHGSERDEQPTSTGYDPSTDMTVEDLMRTARGEDVLPGGPAKKKPAKNKTVTVEIDASEDVDESEYEYEDETDK